MDITCSRHGWHKPMLSTNRPLKVCFDHHFQT
jgi:hypothetical protein